MPNQKKPRGQRKNTKAPARMVVQQQPKRKQKRQRRSNGESGILFTQKPRVSRPAKMSTQNNNLVVTHREMIGTIAMTSSFSTNSCLYGSLNPGLPQTAGGANNYDLSIYSWIQAIANCYEKYRIRKLAIIFEPTCNLSTGNGTVAISVDYDCKDALPTTMAAMINQATGIHGPPYKEMRLNLIPQKEFLYTRSGAVTSTDLKTYDYGYVSVNTEGGTAGPAGRLSVEYQIEFKLPQ